MTADNDDAGGRVTERPATIRFSQVDAAGIVFYARYYELLFRAFPDPPLAAPPYAMQTEFLKPNRLGDRLTLRYRQGPRDDDWSFAGCMDGTEHFRVRSLPGEVPASGLRPARAPVFRAEPVAVGSWGAGMNGYLQLSRYFELVSTAIEEWFDATLDMRFRDLHIDGRIGIPTARFTTRIRALPAAGDTVVIGLRPERIGNSSVTLTSTLWRKSECLIENEQVIVFVKMRTNGFDVIRIPKAVRARLVAQTEEEVGRVAS